MTDTLINSEVVLSASFCEQMNVNMGTKGTIVRDAEQENCVVVKLANNGEEVTVHNSDIRQPRVV